MVDPLADRNRNETIQERAVEFIHRNFGSLRDLPRSVIPVVWVTVYRCMESVMKTEAAGGPNALTKSVLLDGGRLAQEVEASMCRLDLLFNMIPIIRSNESRAAQRADCQLLTDLLKWGIVDAGSMSNEAKSIARRLAAADPEYKNPFPPEIEY